MPRSRRRLSLSHGHVALGQASSSDTLEDSFETAVMLLLCCTIHQNIIDKAHSSVQACQNLTHSSLKVLVFRGRSDAEGQSGEGPKGVMKVVSLEDCLASSICQNPKFASSFVKTFAPLT